ncbi:DUF6461 domain-containing protein [Micromonospora sp. NPDC047548]|uniref:DUF6461 domain-containing protein n=1 Tax=Micromonospora sp. NPDC047548 TaxID=3155624 RepID=UPI0033CC6385
MTDLGRVQRVCDDFGEIFCLTFVKGVDEAEALRRIGAYPDTVEWRMLPDAGAMMHEFDLGYPRMAAAVALDGWSMVIEPHGFHGSDRDLLQAVSRGTEAVNVLRHNYAASHHFGYAASGAMVVAFPPEAPVEGRIWGAAPDRLHDEMLAVGILPADDEYDGYAVARAILLAERITGTTVPTDLLSRTLLSAQIEPWFATGAVAGDLIRRDPYSPTFDRLIDVIDAADPAVQRAVAVDEVRRQAAALGLADTPGLTQHLLSAGGGIVAVDSDLGHHVRAWLTEQDRASWSLNDSNRHRMTNEQRTAAYALGWFTTALRGVLDPDPRVAVLTAVKPLTSTIRAFGGPETVETVIHALQATPTPLK